MHTVDQLASHFSRPCRLWSLRSPCPQLAHADDAAMNGIGGSLRVQHSNGQVQMVSETVAIDKLPTGHVVATFWLKNNGKPIDITVGFPGCGGGDGGSFPSLRRLSRGSMVHRPRSTSSSRSLRTTTQTMRQWSGSSSVSTSTPIKPMSFAMNIPAVGSSTRWRAVGSFLTSTLGHRGAASLGTQPSPRISAA